VPEVNVDVIATWFRWL